MKREREREGELNLFENDIAYVYNKTRHYLSLPNIVWLIYNPSLLVVICVCVCVCASLILFVILAYLVANRSDDGIHTDDCYYIYAEHIASSIVPYTFIVLVFHHVDAYVWWAIAMFPIDS